MTSTWQRKSAPTPLTRHFEPSRHGSAHLAAAFEQALPTIRRSTASDRSSSHRSEQPRQTRRAVS